MASWADSAGDELGKTASHAEAGNATDALPETTISVVGNIKTLTEWYLNDDGKRLKKTTRSKLFQRPCRLKKSVVERRAAPLFGKAVTQGNGGGITRMDTPTEITVTAKVKALEAETAFRKAWKQRNQASAEKWGIRDYSDRTPIDDNCQNAREDIMKMRDQGKSQDAYVPPAARQDATASLREDSRFGRRDEADTVRITNLSEEATENDLQELCRSFGPISRIYVAKDKYTQQSKGFAFVRFHRHGDALRAIEKLNGYGYDNLILHVEWAKPSTNGPR